MDLSEFREELGDVLFHKFFDENYRTARDVLDTPKEQLVAALGLEAEKIDEIVDMLKRGLEEAEVEGDEEAHRPRRAPRRKQLPRRRRRQRKKARHRQKLRRRRPLPRLKIKPRPDRWRTKPRRRMRTRRSNRRSFAKNP